MKIEYFPPIIKEQPVLLIYGDEPENVLTLKNTVHALAMEEIERVAVHELSGFEGVDRCQLFFSVNSYDRGVKLISAPQTFECFIRPLWWENVEDLLQPFCELGAGTWNELTYGFSSEILLIISRDRGW